MAFDLRFVPDFAGLVTRDVFISTLRPLAVGWVPSMVNLEDERLNAGIMDCRLPLSDLFALTLALSQRHVAAIPL